MKLWIATAVDYGDSRDGKARVLGVFKSYDEARIYVDGDIFDWVERNCEDGVKCDFDKMAARSGCDDSIRCKWNIEEADFNQGETMSREVKTIVAYQTDQSATIVGVEMNYRDKYGYPWSVYDCIRWCEENGYDYIVKEY